MGLKSYEDHTRIQAGDQRHCTLKATSLMDMTTMERIVSAFFATHSHRAWLGLWHVGELSSSLKKNLKRPLR